MLDLRLGDCLDVLTMRPSGSVSCCVTSPPYFGLRDYGVKGQLGLEATPEAYVARMVEVFREVRRVLADDGTLWLNLGDSYATGGGKVGSCPGGGSQGERWKGHRGTRGGSAKHAAGALGPMTQPNRMPLPGLKPKDLIGIPWRVAFALQADGWYLRSDIIWHKPNPMPESVRDRPTRAHEYLFLLTKSDRYYYDADAVREPAVSNPNDGRRGDGGNYSFKRTALKTHMGVPEGGRNRRTVWTICPRPYKGAHFAPFPPALVEPCILAGCPQGGVVLDPFMGSGTTGLVALTYGRRFVGIELSPAYLELARERLAPWLVQARQAA